MCLDFDGHHSGGSSLICISYLDYVLKCGPYPQVSVLFKKKKNQVKSPSPESRVPETGSDPPIGSGRDSGRDRHALGPLMSLLVGLFLYLYPYSGLSGLPVKCGVPV